MRKKNTVLLILFVSLFLMSCGKKTIDLEDYITIEFSGINGYAKAVEKVDWESLESQFLSENTDDDMLLESLSTIYELENSIKITIDKTENLSNGEIVVLKAECNKDIQKKLDINIKNLEVKTTVEGLRDGEVIDLFANMEIKYTGMSPKANLKLSNNGTGTFWENVYYQADKAENLKKGDAVKVTASYPIDIAEQEGYIIKTVEKNISVDDVDEYISEFSQIDEQILDLMKRESTDLINASLASKSKYKPLMTEAFRYSPSVDWIGYIYGFDYKINSPNLSNIYFFKLKDGIYNTSENSIFLVYQLEVDDSVAGKTTAYIPVKYSNIIKMADGSIKLDPSTRKIAYSSYDFEVLYNQLVTGNKDDFTCEEIDMK